MTSRRRGTLRPMMATVLVVTLSCGPLPVHGADPAESGGQTLVAALHVHSTASTGGLSLAQLAEEAERLGLDALILSDNFVLRYEFGLWPFRGIIRKRVAFPSVLEYGIGRYLDELVEVQARHPRVLLVPGLEVAPHYVWTGSMLAGTLTMENSQRNLLAIGLTRPEDMAGLPVAGNPESDRYGWESVLNLVPLLVLGLAAWLWSRRRGQSVRLRRLRATAALILAGPAVLALISAWPFSQPLYSTYDAGLGYRPYQTFIDAVVARGGVTIWSMPEARDFHQYPVGLLGVVTVKTEPYPEALLRTSGYTAFGGIYLDNHPVTQPGGLWDQALNLYLAGQRSAPPIAVGETAFHGPGQDSRRLDQVVTIFQVRERTVAGVLAALQSGRLYAASQDPHTFGLRLDTFRVESASGTRTAESGGILDPGWAEALAIRLAVSTTDQGRHPVTVTVIRGGRVMFRLSGKTPLHERLEDPEAPAVLPTFYRLHVLGGRSELLSNPIFVRAVTKRS